MLQYINLLYLPFFSIVQLLPPCDRSPTRSTNQPANYPTIRPPARATMSSSTEQQQLAATPPTIEEAKKLSAAYLEQYVKA